MSFPNVHQADLQAHPVSPSEAIETIAVRIGTQPATVTLEYSLHGDLSRLRIPSGTGGRADGLWHHTCFEAFIAPTHAQEYLELNFAPSQQWAAYQFDSYRQGMRPADLEPPRIDVRSDPTLLQLAATITLPPDFALRGARLALAAVIEEDSGRLCYWAARHAPRRPDFHHPDGFVLELP